MVPVPDRYTVMSNTNMSIGGTSGIHPSIIASGVIENR